MWPPKSLEQRTQIFGFEGEYASQKNSSSNSSDDEIESVNKQSVENVKVERGQLKFSPTVTAQAMFQKYESEFYDNKECFVDAHSEGQMCSNHGNQWSDLDPVGGGSQIV